MTAIKKKLFTPSLCFHALASQRTLSLTSDHLTPMGQQGYHNLLSDPFGLWVSESSHDPGSGPISWSTLTQHPPPSQRHTQMKSPRRPPHSVSLNWTPNGFVCVRRLSAPLHSLGSTKLFFFFISTIWLLILMDCVCWKAINVRQCFWSWCLPEVVGC